MNISITFNNGKSVDSMKKQKYTKFKIVFRMAVNQIGSASC